MNNRERLLCLLFLLAALAAAPPVFAQDAGLVLSLKAELTDGEEQPYGALAYTGAALPWLAAPLGDRADLYLSGGFSARYADEEWSPLPEIHRFELLWEPLPALRLELGRLPFRGNSSVLAGLFDGASFTLNVGGARLGGGVFYTGLLYKKAALIIMNSEERADYMDQDVYFASRRLAAEIHWEHTGIFGTRTSLSLGGAAQFDMNDADAQFHSQYFEAKVGAPLGRSIHIELGGVAELAENAAKEWHAAFAGSTEIQWLLPTALQDRLTLAGWFSSGDWNDRVGAFVPLTMQARGKILRSESSGVALAEAAYTGRLHPAFALDLSGAYYFRTDSTTFTHPDIDPDSSSPFLGGEVYGGFSWTPVSDLLFSAAGGVFFPRTGKAFARDAALVYRAAATVTISL